MEVKSSYFASTAATAKLSLQKIFSRKFFSIVSNVGFAAVFGAEAAWCSTGMLLKSLVDLFLILTLNQLLLNFYLSTFS